MLRRESRLAWNHRIPNEPNRSTSMSHAHCVNLPREAREAPSVFAGFRLSAGHDTPGAG
ncbi:hypothetical protein BIFDEN_00389 [Bifidobacterium dentium ATCC 27678]|nr:hypothetical protein BIFDEN_00389 [Bifidobacterium dentium ATCC 27678]